MWGCAAIARRSAERQLSTISTRIRGSHVYISPSLMPC
jgi:hypothetical protein